MNFDTDFNDDEDNQCKYCDVKNCPDRQAEYISDDLDNGDLDFDYDDDGYKDDDDELFDFLSDFPPEIKSIFMEVALKYGGKDGILPDPRELAQKDPMLVEQVLKVLLDAETDDYLPALDSDWFPGSRRRSRKSRRKR
jgi:hypothetical protein